MSQLTEGILFSLGNPLLDISAEVGPEVLTKYGLTAGNACLAEEKHLPLYDELVKNYKVEYIAGGAAQNAVRALQWMLQKPGVSNYIGCVGNDEYGKKLKEAAENGGVKTHYLIDNTTPTGTCAVLVTDKERSLCANLAAANNYKQTHFDSQEIQELVNKAQYFYCTGFFLTHSPNVLKSMGVHAAANNKVFTMNLSAPFLISFFWDQMASVLPYTDVIFSNESEAETFGNKLGWGSDLKEIAVKLSNYEKENKKRTRTVVFTQGANQTIVCVDGKVQTFSPILCPKEEIVDVNGAGDSFVGGFLSRYIQGKPIEECVAAGHYCAYECIRRSGATFPPQPNFTYPLQQ